MATISLINPFPNDVRTVFQEYITGETYVNREHLPYDKQHQMHVFLDSPALKLEDRANTNLKYQALTKFELY